jgi:hypothetical protein
MKDTVLFSVLVEKKALIMQRAAVVGSGRNISLQWYWMDATWKGHSR